MLVNVSFEEKEESLTYVDVIDVPQKIAMNIDSLQAKFFEWMFDKENNHRYWVIRDGMKKYCNYSTEAFIDWLNTYILNDEKATMIASSTKQIDLNLPVIYF